MPRKNLFDVVADSVVVDDTIKPCPVCGSGNVSVMAVGVGFSRVQCDECDHSALGRTDDDAVRKWNRRNEA